MESRSDSISLSCEDDEVAILRSELHRERRRNADLTEENTVLRNTLLFYISGPRKEEEKGRKVNRIPDLETTTTKSDSGCSAKDIKQRNNLANGLASYGLADNSVRVRDLSMDHEDSSSMNDEITAVESCASNGLPNNPYEKPLEGTADGSCKNSVEEPDSNSTCRPNRYSGTQMAKAIQICQNGELSMSKASRMFGVPLSTLRSKMNDPLLHPFKEGQCSRVFTDDEEMHLVDLITQAANLGIPFNLLALKKLLHREAQKKGQDFKFSWNWCHGFRHRHPCVSELLSGAKNRQSAGSLNGE